MKIRSQPKLPDDIVFNVLSRLPFKSLLRFKCVCKSWLSIITHPQFIKTHLKQSTKSRLLLKTKESRLYSHSFVSLDFEAASPNLDSKSLQCPSWTSSDSYLQPWCSCHGIILMSVNCRGTKSGQSLILWNPSNGSHKRISSCPYELPDETRYGLCYDSTADDYKVFIVFYESIDLQENYTSSVVIYSLRDGSWKSFIDNRVVLDDGPFRLAVVNGAVHWVVKSDSWVIVYFDLVEEKFKELPVPGQWNDEENVNLVVLGGFLCVYLLVDLKKIHVYAMKDYGKKESWVRLFIMPFAIESSSDLTLWPLCLTKKGQVLVSMEDKRICIYDPEYCTFLVYDSVRGGRAIPYVETLVSLNDGV